MAHYVAKEWQTSGNATVNVYLKENGPHDQVVVEEKEDNL